MLKWREPREKNSNKKLFVADEVFKRVIINPVSCVMAPKSDVTTTL